MSESNAPTPEQIARQILLQLQGLQSAGIESIPRPLAPLPIAKETHSTPPPGSASLFAGEQAQNETSPDVRIRELKVLAEEVSHCSRCPELASSRTQTVFGVGPVDPEVCFVGEAPGRMKIGRGNRS